MQPNEFLTDKLVIMRTMSCDDPCSVDLCKDLGMLYKEEDDKQPALNIGENHKKQNFEKSKFFKVIREG